MNGTLLGIGLLAIIVVLLAVLWIVLKALHNVQIELRGVNERVSGMEHNQARVDQGIGDLRTGLAKTDSATARLMSATAVIHDQLVHAKEGVAQIQTHNHARQGLEEQTAESIKRLEAVIAGTQSKGAAGENILETLFARLPAEWQVRDFQVGNKSVEFGLRLPNRLVLPIDSKWPATHLIETFLATEDPNERQRVKTRIEAAVRDKAKEVRKYIDPNVTVNFGIAAVPDAVYELCTRVQTDVFQWNVALVSYSMVVPYLLLVFQTVLRSAQTVDTQKLDACLRSIEDGIAAMQAELDGRFSRALTMIDNSRSELRAHLGRVAGGLTSLQIAAPSTDSERPTLPVELT